MSKLKEQELVWANQVAKVAPLLVIEKKKSRICQLDLKVTMF